MSLREKEPDREDILKGRSLLKGRRLLKGGACKGRSLPY